MEIKDLTGLGQPLTKLLEVVQAGVGGWFAPYQIKRLAHAKAECIRITSAAETEAQIAKATALASLPPESLVYISDASKEIAKRAALRIAHTEVNRQKNIEKIVESAVRSLPEQVADDKPDQTWINRFFGIATEISDNNLQELWGRILAGEIARSGQFSLRTLETLRNLSQQEAQIFSRACALVWDHQLIFWIPKSNMGQYPIDDVGALAECGLSYADRLLLSEAGLVNVGDIKVKLDFFEGRCSFIHNSKKQILELTRIDPSKPRPDIVNTPRIHTLPGLHDRIDGLGIIKLTTAGEALSHLVTEPLHEGYAKTLAERYFRWGIEMKYLPRDDLK